MGRITEAVKHLIIINVLFFILPQLAPNLGLQNMFALYFPENPQFGFWQFVTHMFMHGGFSHILFNMYGLWAFGTPLEQMWGRNKFLFFYFSAGLGAGAIYT
ncbi:MAG: rhomboid family intramembrane serine protease, partial [Lutibacter sp.]|uniref:rhomboid family intramembrane serine protease n=1 Tax=Lutibacter sp. TaxID=1925666 RepID=UPI003858D6B3